MRHVRTTALTLLVAAACVTTLSAGDEKKEAAKPENKLIGTRKLVSAKYGGQEFNFPEGHTMLKHVTPSQFMWATYDSEGKVTRTAGGPYSLKGDKYEETPEYGFSQDFETIKGKTHSFTWRVEGNKWHHDGKLANGLTIEEVWERVEQK
jgi:hypothetical protein